MNQSETDLGIVDESQLLRFGIRRHPASSAGEPCGGPIGWHITGPKAGPAAAGLPDSGKGYPVHGAGPDPDYTTDYNGARNLFAAHRLS
jgi:hypothetical protein